MESQPGIPTSAQTGGPSCSLMISPVVLRISMSSVCPNGTMTAPLTALHLIVEISDSTYLRSSSLATALAASLAFAMYVALFS